MKEEGQEVPDDFWVDKKVQCFVDQNATEMVVRVESAKGECVFDGIRYRPNDDLGEASLKPGTYEMYVKDITEGLPPRMRMATTKMLIKLADLDEEAAIAAAAAAAAAAAKGGKKK